MYNSTHEGIGTGQPAREQRMSAIARMALGISHELNNVFGAVQSNVDIMRSHLPSDSPLKANLNHIQHASAHALELTRLLQVYTQRGKTILTTVNLPPMLSEIIKTFKSAQAASCGVQEIPMHGKLHVNTCPVMLANALNGILQNAADALQGKCGTITIETSTDKTRVHANEGLLLGILPLENAVVIEISDTGEGIQPEALEHILEPFFSTRTRARGLGLTPAAGLVFHCNAAIHIVSTPGRGTTVQLLLPATE